MTAVSYFLILTDQKINMLFIWSARDLSAYFQYKYEKIATCLTFLTCYNNKIKVKLLFAMMVKTTFKFFFSVSTIMRIKSSNMFLYVKLNISILSVILQSFLQNPTECQNHIIVTCHCSWMVDGGTFTINSTTRLSVSAA